MSKQKILRNRLDDLFTDLEQEATHIPADQDALPGWTWECDSRGYYTACSPEVGRILGVEAEAFLEQPLVSFGLSRQSSSALAVILQAGNFPVEVALQFQAEDGSRVSVRAHISYIEPNESDEGGWRGLNQVVELEQPTAIEHSAPQPPRPEPITGPAPTPPAALSGAYPHGIAVEEEKMAFSVSRPYTPTGQLSIQERQTFAHAASPDAPAALAVPVDLQDHSLGLLEIIDDSPNRIWSQDDQRLVEQVADQLSLALENARLFQNTQSALARTEALFQVSKSAIAFENVEELLQSVADTITEVLPAERTLVAVINLDRKELTHFFESNAPPIPTEGAFQELMDGLTGWCIREHKPALSLKGSIDPRESEKAHLTREETDAGSLVVVPMLYQDEVFGTLTAINTLTQPDFTQSDVELLTAMANQVATALANAQLFQQITARSAEMILINRVVTQLSSSLDLTASLQIVANELGLGLSLASSGIALLNPSRTELTVVADYARSDETRSGVGAVLPLAGNLSSQRVIETKQSLIIDDACNNPLTAPIHDTLRQRCVQTLMIIPLIVRENVIGTVGLNISETERSFTDEEIQLAETLVAQASTAIQNARLFQNTQTALARTEALFQVGQSAIAFENIEELLQSVADTIAEVLPAARTLVAAINLDKEELTHLFESNAPPIPIEDDTFQQFMDGITGWCIREHKPALSLKEGVDPRESEKTLKIRAESDAGSLIVVPMLYQDQIYGTLTAVNTFSQPNFTQSDVDLLTAMSSQVATALANAQLFQQEQHRRRIADTLSETARVVGATLDLKDVGDRLLVQLADVVEFDTASLQVIEGDQSRRISGYSRTKDKTISSHPKLLLSISQDPLISAVIQSRQPLVLTDTQADPRWKSVPEAAHIRSWITAPLLTQDKVIGMLTLDHSEPGTYDEETADLLSAIAAQASVAVRNARLFEQAQSYSTQLQTAAEVSQAASSILEPDLLIQQTVSLIRERFNLYYVGLFLVDESGEWTNEPGKWAVLRSGTGEAGRIQVERGHKLDIGGGSMISECITSTKAQTPSRVSDTTQRFVNPLLPETRTEIALPLVSRGQVLGAMSIQSNVEDAFSAEDVAVLQTMADQVANALQNANLFDQTQARAEELAMLNEMSRALSANLDTDTILRSIYLYSSRLIDTSTFFVALYNEENNEISFPLSIEDNQYIDIPTRALEAGLTEYVIRNREAVLIREEVEGWIRDHGIELRLVGAMSQSWLGVPILMGEQAIGIICVQNETPQHFSERHRDLMIAIASQSAIAIQNAQLFSQTQDALADTEALLTITSVASSSLELENTLAEVLSQVLTATDSDAGLITIFNPTTQTLNLMSHQLPEALYNIIREKGLADTLCGLVYQRGEPIIIESLAEGAPADVTGLLALGFQSYQGIPLESKGVVLGSLCTFRKEILAPQETNITLLQAAGQQIGVAIENANLFEQTQTQAANSNILNEMARVLTGLHDIDSVADSLYEYTSRLMDTTSFYVALVDDRVTEISFVLHILNNERCQTAPMKLGGGLSNHIIRTGKSLLLSDDVPAKMEALGIDVILIGDSKLPKSYLGSPLIIGENIIGLIAVQSRTTPRLYTEYHRDLLESLASQAAIAIQSARLFGATRRQTEELAVLNEMSRVLNTLLNVDQIIQTIHEYTSRLMDTTFFFVSLYDSKEETISFPLVFEKGEISSIPSMKKNRGLTQHVIDTKEPLLIMDNIQEVIAEFDLEHILIGAPAKSWLGVPLIIGQDVLGVIVTQNATTPNVFDEHHRDLLVSIARQASIAIQTARLFGATRQQTEDLAVLNEMSRVLTDPREIDKIIDSVYDYTSRLMDTTIFYIAFYDEDTDEITRPLTIVNGERIDLPSRKLKRGLTEYIIRTGEPLLIEENVLAKMEEMDIELSRFDKDPALSWLGAPFLIGDRVIGVISVQSTTTPRLYNSRHRDLLMSIASQTAISLQNARLFAETQQHVQNLTTLSDVSESLVSAPLNVKEVADVVVRQFVEAMNIPEASVLLVTDENSLEIIADIYQGSNDEYVYDEALGRVWSLSESTISSQVLDTLEPQVIRASDSDIDITELAHLEAHEVGTLVIIPLVVKGQAIGIIKLEIWDKKVRYTSDQLNLAMTLANQSAVALDNSRLYENQIETAEELRELDKLKSQFLANMSHELRTPLNSIIGFSRVIMKGIDGPVTDIQHQDLSAIYNAGHHLLKMINDILDISKVDAGKMELTFEDVYLPDIIDSVISTARGLLKEKPVKLITAIADDLPNVTADSTRVRQILLNLLSNSVKFTEEGSITVAARKQANSYGQPEIYISITDTGIGISPENHEKLFQPFMQIDGSSTRNTGGTGLGLSITRLLVDLHGGEIGMDSDIGKGSTFYFTLPLAGATPPPPDVDGSTTILAIDDDPQVIQLYERYLSDSGYQVVPLTDPSKILEYAQEIQPFAITLDILLPEHDGWQLLQDLKNDPETKHIPVVICSILEDAEKGRKLGANDYLTKPILKDDLMRALKRISA